VNRKFEYINTKMNKIKAIGAALVLLLFVGSNLFADVKILYPLNGEILRAGETTEIRWESIPNSVYTVKYSTDEGTTWELIAEDITADRYNWSVLTDILDVKFRVEERSTIPPRLLRRMEDVHDHNVYSVAMSPDGQKMITAGRDMRVKIWNISDLTLDEQIVTGDSGSVYDAMFAGNSESIIYVKENELVYRDLTDDSETTMTGLFTDLIRSVAYHNEKDIFAAASYDGNMKIFTKAGFTEIASYSTGAESELYKIVFSHSGDLAAFAGGAGIIYIFDIQNNTVIGQMTGHGDVTNKLVWSLAFSQDDQSLVSCGVDGTVRVWDLTTFEEKVLIDAHSFHIRAVDWHPTENMILSASLDKYIKQWDPTDGAKISESMQHGGQVLDAMYSSTGDTIISCGRDHAMNIWKNIQTDYSEDSVDCLVRYPATVSLPHIVSAADRKVKIPLIFESNLIPPGGENKYFDAEVSIEIPSKLLDISLQGEHYMLFNDPDTVNISLKSIILDGAILTLDGLTIAGIPNIADLKILNIETTDENYYIIDKIDGSIRVPSDCIGDSFRGVSFASEPLSMKLSPAPVSSTVKISMNLIEEGRHKLELINLQGEIISVLEVADYNPGPHITTIDMSDFASGHYFLRIVGPTRSLTGSCVISR
jgi:WD40 repeat protein